MVAPFGGMFNIQLVTTLSIFLILFPVIIVEVKPWAQNQPTINIHIKDASPRTLEADSNEVLRGVDTLHFLPILRTHGDNSVEKTE